MKQLVRKDLNRLGQIDRGLLGCHRDADDSLTSVDLVAIEPRLFVAEQEG